MQNVIFIIDGKTNAEMLIGFVKKRKTNSRPNFYICPITVNNALIRLIENGISKYGNTTILPFIGEFHKNAFLYRNKFIEFLSDFSTGKGKGRINLRKYFSYPSGKFSLWWFSSVAEKNTLKKGAYHDLAKLITIVDFQDTYSINEIYVDIENNALKKAILKNKSNRKVHVKGRAKDNITVATVISLAKALGYAVFFVIRKCILYLGSRKDFLRKVSTLRKSKLLLVTNFPFAEKELLKKNVFKNKYFGLLQTSAERRYKNEISWVGILQHNDGLSLSEIKLVKDINTWGYCLFMPEELISFGKIGKSILVFLYMCFKYAAKIPYLSRHFTFNYRREINIWHIFREAWDYSFWGSYLLKGLLYYHAFSNVISELADKTVIMYPSELYTWENALNIARKGKDTIKTVGIQHASVPFLFLSYFNTIRDFEDRGTFDSFPLPDRLATSGNIPNSLLLDGGWPRERLFDLGAYRYHGLSKFLQKEINWNQREKRVVVALSSTREETKEILLMLWQTFRDKDICPFIIKPHPACPIEDIVSSIGFGLIESKFILSIDKSLEDLLISSRAVIVAGSTVSIEGIACQCPVIIPRLSCKADMNPLSKTSEELAKYVENEKELVETVRLIVNAEKSPIGFEECKSFIKNYCTIVSNEDEYFMRLEKEFLNVTI